MSNFAPSYRSQSREEKKNLAVDEKQCFHYCQIAPMACCWLPAFIRVRPVGRGPVGVAPREAPDSLCNVFFSFVATHQIIQ